MENDVRKKPNRELSEKIVGMIKALEGQRMGAFPIQSVTKWLDAKLVSIERGKVELEYTVRPEMTNPGGFLHGGIQGTMLDDAIGMICATLGYDVAALSIDMHLDFLGTSKAGDILRARAEVEREGSSVIHASAELVNPAGELVAKAQSNVLVSNQPAAYMAMLGLK